MPQCPHCKGPVISWWEKYKAAKWALVRCPECDGLSCSYPYLLVIYTMLYVWDVLLFGTLAYIDKNIWYVVALVVFWGILDYFSVYLPLSAMKRKTSAQQSPGNEEDTNSSAPDPAKKQP